MPYGWQAVDGGLLRRREADEVSAVLTRSDGAVFAELTLAI